MDIVSTTGYSVLCTIFITAMAQLSFDLPEKISTVPVTMQTFAINIIPIIFDVKIATLASVWYYLCIAMGLPVGAGREGGSKKLYGPTGGYLVGFILASFQMGVMLETGAAQDPQSTFMALLIGNAIILLCGLVWLPFGLSFKTGKPVSNFSNMKDVLMWGLIPFIPGDLIKIVLAMAIQTLLLKST